MFLDLVISMKHYIKRSSILDIVRVCAYVGTRARRVQHFLDPGPIGSGSTQRALLGTQDRGA